MALFSSGILLISYFKELDFQFIPKIDKFFIHSIDLLRELK